MTAPETPPAQEPLIKLPPTLVLLLIILVIAAAAARLLPAGEFERASATVMKRDTQQIEYTVQQGDTLASIAAEHGDVATIPEEILDADNQRPVAQLEPGMTVLLTVHQTGTRTVVVPGSYAPVEREPAPNLFAAATGFIADIVRAPIQGFENKAGVIAFILLIGGAFGIILATGAVDAALRSIVAALTGSGGSGLIVIPIIMVLFSVGGAVFGMSEEVIPFVMITIPLALRLGYDSITGLCMSFVAAGLGFAGAFFNPFTVQIAQGIAGIPPVSGWQFRVAVWILVTIIGIAYTLCWAMRVKNRPDISPAFETDKQLRKRYMADGDAPEASASITVPQILVLLTLAVAIGIIMWGVSVYQWYITELSGVFVGAGIVAAIVGRMPAGKAVDAFVRGAADLVGAALIVAFSAGILVVLEDARVLDTILNAIATRLEGTHDIVAVNLMFLFQTLLNFFVPSGSGQAAMTMPIIAPLSELIGVSKQTAVLAYQFGDGFGNMIIPTSAVTMSVLGIAQIPWEKWAKWLLPLEIILALFGVGALTVAVLIGYK